ncbi:MAG: dephospho-CoA kinase [Gorillibacterium sp.]|nr:dephospho-CoA kinase [Gorillibacterium sp.]
MIIGLTGGIACGKSTVAAMLVSRGAALVDADHLAREATAPGSMGLQQIAERFGLDMLQMDGALDRKRLGVMVFNDEKALKDLEAILHPHIRAEISVKMHELDKLEPDRLVVVDVPLLYESGMKSMFPQIMVVYVPRDIQLKRLMLRDGLSEEQAQQRLKVQMPIEEKKVLADILIDNSDSLEATEQQIDEFWHRKELSGSEGIT